jgi:hypothetical protein
LLDGQIAWFENRVKRFREKYLLPFFGIACFPLAHPDPVRGVWPIATDVGCGGRAGRARRARIGSLGDGFALFLGHGSIDVQHKWIDVPAELGDYERHPLAHQVCDEGDIARQAVQLGDDNLGLQPLGHTKRCGELWALVQGVRTFAGLDLDELLGDL